MNTDMEDKYKLLEEKCKLLEDRCKSLEEKCHAYEERRREIGEKRKKAANTRWTRHKDTDASTSVSKPKSLKEVVAWQQEEEKRAQAFQVNLYKPEESKEVNVAAPCNEEQVYEYMHSYTMGARFIDARDEARRFMDFYIANGWVMGQTPMRDWRAAARNWVNKVTKHLDKRQQQEYDAAKTYANTLKLIQEDARDWERRQAIAEQNY